MGYVLFMGMIVSQPPSSPEPARDSQVRHASLVPAIKASHVSSHAARMRLSDTTLPRVALRRLLTSSDMRDHRQLLLDHPLTLTRCVRATCYRSRLRFALGQRQVHSRTAPFEPPVKPNSHFLAVRQPSCSDSALRKFQLIWKVRCRSSRRVAPARRRFNVLLRVDKALQLCIIERAPPERCARQEGRVLRVVLHGRGGSLFLPKLILSKNHGPVVCC